MNKHSVTHRCGIILCEWEEFERKTRYLVGTSVSCGHLALSAAQVKTTSRMRPVHCVLHRSPSPPTPPSHNTSPRALRRQSHCHNAWFTCPGARGERRGTYRLRLCPTKFREVQERILWRNKLATPKLIHTVARRYVTSVRQYTLSEAHASTNPES
jgi:hypothetical protein